MARSLGLYIAEIFQSSFLIEKYVVDVDFEKFESDYMIHDAVIRNLTIIGEATKHFPRDIRDKFPNILWTDIVGLRNIAVHVYYELDYKNVWDVVKIHLPKYVVQLKDVTKLVLGLDDKGFNEFIELVKSHIK